MNKKLILITTALLVSVGTLFAVPNDPQNFYGEVTVNDKIIEDTTLNYYLNDNLAGSKSISDSKYGAGFDKIVLSGEDGDTVEFELISNSCASSSTKISHTFQEGVTQKLDLDFTGSNTCNDASSSSGGGSSSGGSSSGGGSSSSSGSSTQGGGGEWNFTDSENETQIDTPEQVLDINSDSSNSRQTSFIQNFESETTGSVEDIEVITTDSSNSIESDIEIKKEVIPGLGGNIVANNKNSLIGIISLILLIIGFLIWRQNKINSKKK
jgi:hypothetical protein